MQYKHILAVASVLALAACNPMGNVMDEGSSSSSADSDGEVSSQASSMEQATMTGGGGGTAGVQARIVDVAVTNGSITPATITAKQGEKVQLRITGGEGIHGLMIGDLGINLRIEPGSVTVVDLPTDAKGSFAGRCNIPCGEGHKDMKLNVVIE